MKIIPVATDGGYVRIDVSEDLTESRTFLTPDEALGLAAGLLTAANDVNGYPRTGVFA